MKIRRLTLLIVAVLLASTLGLAYAFNLLTQSYLYKTPPSGQMIVTGPSTLNFGTLSLTPETTIIFNDTLTISGGPFTPITIQLAHEDTTWKKVFASVELLVVGKEPPCPIGASCPIPLVYACISFGFPACGGSFVGLTPTFTPTYAQSDNYQVTYTVVSGDIPSNVQLQTTWSR